MALECSVVLGNTGNAPGKGMIQVRRKVHIVLDRISLVFQGFQVTESILKRTAHKVRNKFLTTLM